MTTERVKVEKELLYDLLDFKIRSLNEEIQSILTRWKYNSADLFLEDARDGTLKNAEMDAILLRQLIYDRDMLVNKKAEY